MLLRHEGFRRLCHARRRLTDAWDEAPSIEAIAREVGISPFHFIRLMSHLPPALFSCHRNFREAPHHALPHTEMEPGVGDTLPAITEDGCASS